MSLGVGWSAAGSDFLIDQGVLEAELEGDVFVGIAIVVHMNFVKRIRVHGEVVGSAVGILQRLVVSNQRDEILAALLVAAEHVEISGVDFRVACNERCFAMAGGLNCWNESGTGQHQDDEHGEWPYRATLA